MLPVKITSDHLLLTVDLAATLFLGIQGGLAAIQANLDLFGIMVLAFATALGGGVIRDLLIGDIPPASIRNIRYPVTAFGGGLLAFLLYQSLQRVPLLLMTSIDAAGLGLFAVAGAAKAYNFQIAPFMAILMGTITAVGGGTTRDIFLARIPGILRVDVYAVAAMAGAAVLIIGLRSGLPRTLMMFAGFFVCFLLRFLAVWQHWNLPRAGEL